MLLRSIICFVFIGVLVSYSSAAFGQEYVIVVHKEFKDAAISAKELRRIFLGKAKRWPDGRTVLVAYNCNDVSHEQFSRNLVHKSPGQLNTFWRRSLYSGRSVLPYQADNSEQLLAYLKRNKNAIGYLSRSDLRDPFKEVRITP